MLKIGRLVILRPLFGGKQLIADEGDSATKDRKSEPACPHNEDHLTAPQSKLGGPGRIVNCGQRTRLVCTEWHGSYNASLL